MAENDLPKGEIPVGTGVGTGAPINPVEPGPVVSTDQANQAPANTNVDSAADSGPERQQPGMKDAMEAANRRLPPHMQRKVRPS